MVENIDMVTNEQFIQLESVFANLPSTQATRPIEQCDRSSSVSADSRTALPRDMDRLTRGFNRQSGSNRGFVRGRPQQ